MIKAVILFCLAVFLLLVYIFISIIDSLQHCEECNGNNYEDHKEHNGR